MDSKIDLEITGLEEWKASLKTWTSTAWADLQLAETEVRRAEDHVRTRTLCWTRQVERCRDEVGAAEQNLHDCRSSDDDCREEEYALEIAMQALRAAEEKLKTARYWVQRLEKTAGSYRFSANKMRTTLATEMPRASSLLEAKIVKLREGLAVQIAGASTSAISGSATAQSVGQTSVQGVSAAATAEIESLIAEGKKREALGRCLVEIRGAFPDISQWLDANPQVEIRYDPRESMAEKNDYAVTSFDNALTPEWTRVKNLAFASAASLYSTLGHEFIHYGQALRPESAQQAKDDPGRMRAHWEFEAFAWEIENAHATGLSNYPQELEFLKGAISDWYKNLKDPDQALYQAEYERCLGIVNRLLGQATA